jgi:NADPH-dependent F420 reductase
MSQEHRIAIVGTGNVGGNLGVRFTQSGHTVRFGAKNAGKDLAALLDRCGGRASVTAVAESAAWAEIVFLAVPAAAVVDAARSLGDVSGKVVVDCTNPLRWQDGPVWAPPAEGSAAQAVAAAVPAARVVKSFNGFGAEIHLDPKLGAARADVYLAGDDAAAKKLVSDIAASAGFEPVDAGPLRNAGVLENMAILWIHLAMVGGKGRQFAFKMLYR